MMRVRSEPRSTRKLVAKPSMVAAKAATSRPKTGSGRFECLARRPATSVAEAEKRCVAERNNARVSEDQIEREREKGEDCDFGEDQMLVR